MLKTIPSYGLRVQAEVERKSKPGMLPIGSGSKMSSKLDTQSESIGDAGFGDCLQLETWPGAGPPAGLPQWAAPSRATGYGESAANSSVGSSADGIKGPPCQQEKWVRRRTKGSLSFRGPAASP